MSEARTQSATCTDSLSIPLAIPPFRDRQGSYVMGDRVVLNSVVAGGLGGTMGMFVGVPFDMVKVNMQSKPKIYQTTLQTLRLIVRREGAMSLYRGCLPPLLSQLPINGLIFGGESVGMRILDRYTWKSKDNPVRNILAGGFAGLVQCLVLVPTDLVKCKLQVHGGASTGNKPAAPVYNGVMHCVYKIVQADGFFTLFRGMTISVIREIPSYAVYFGIYRSAKRSYIKPKDSGISKTLKTMAIGGLSGSVMWSVVYPIDVIKTRIQTAKLDSSNAARSILPITIKVYNKYGFNFFYRGLGVTLVRAFFVSATTFSCYELFSSLIG